MNFYRLKGIVSYKIFCVCGYCEGHSRRLLVNDLAVAESDQDALKKLLDGHFGDNRFNVPNEEQPLVDIFEMSSDDFENIKEDCSWVWGW